MRLFQVLLILICGFVTAAAQERYLKLVDEGKSDPSFLAFRTKLIAAAEKRDAKYVLSIIDRNIRTSFGDNHGLADFNRMWKISDPNDPFWDEFLAVIKNGGKFYKERGSNTRRQFYAPYTFTSFPDRLDSFEHVAIIGKSVNMRANPDNESPVVATLSYNLAKVDYEKSVKDDRREGDFLWLMIETFGGKRGFVDARYARSPADYRAAFNKKQGKWKMTAFIAGD